ncbi:MAG: hypothetical protein KAT62_08510 [Desulfuromonadales bacterium]|nr:hypothetical protein [Desulfuromonadales bacterium]
MAPSHASASRKGGGEALTGGVQAGLLSSEITFFGLPTQYYDGESMTRRCAIVSDVTGPAESENQGMYASSLHGNREIRGVGRPLSMVGPVGAGQGRNPDM